MITEEAIKETILQVIEGCRAAGFGDFTTTLHIKRLGQFGHVEFHVPVYVPPVSEE
jgi:hypothetical protein